MDKLDQSFPYEFLMMVDIVQAIEMHKLFSIAEMYINNLRLSYTLRNLFCFPCFVGCFDNHKSVTNVMLVTFQVCFGYTRNNVLTARQVP